MATQGDGLGDFLRFYTERYDREKSTLAENLVAFVDGRIAGVEQRFDAKMAGVTDLLNTNNQLLGAIMATLDDVKKQEQANSDLAQKTLGELKAKLAEVTDVQPQIDAAVKKAVDAQKADDQAAFDAAMQEIADLQAKQTAILQETDAQLPDAPAPAPAPEPTGEATT